MPVYPTQLWEVLTGLTLFTVLSLMWSRWRRFDGQILAAMMVLYAIARITIEGFRGDTVRGVNQLGTGLSTSQLVSVGLVLLAGLIVALRARRGVAPETPVVWRDDEDEDGGSGSQTPGRG